MLQADSIQTVMRALADPTRRAVFERVAATPDISVVELTRGSGVTQGAVSQHLKALKEAGLVAQRPEGRNVFYRAATDGLSPLADWLRTYHRFWSGRLDTLEKLLRDQGARKPKTPKGDQK